jgi:hypothetical protein
VIPVENDSGYYKAERTLPMKRLAIVLVTMLLSAVACYAQNPAETQPATAPAQGTAATANTQSPQGSQMQLPAGTLIPAELSKTVDAHKAKSGDKVEAKVATDLQARSGETVIPKGSKITGHVTDVKAKSKADPSSTLGIAFDRIAMKDGRELPFNAEIQALRKPQMQTQTAGGNEPMSESPSGAPSVGGPMQGGSTGGATRAGTSSGPYPSGATSETSGQRGSTANAGGGAAAPQLTGNSQGVVGSPDLSLQQSAQGSTVTAQNENVRLDSGTQMILRVKNK